MGAKIGITGIFAIVGIIIILFTTLSGIITHSFQYMTTKDPKYQEMITNDLQSITTQGQSNIVLGVNGLKSIQNNEIVGEARTGLITFYKEQIILGIFLTGMYIWLFGLLIGKIGTGLTGQPVPGILKWGLSIFAIGMLSLVVNWPTLPYHGFIELIKNLNVISII